MGRLNKDGLFKVVDIPPGLARNFTADLTRELGSLPEGKALTVPFDGRKPLSLRGVAFAIARKAGMKARSRITADDLVIWREK